MHVVAVIGGYPPRPVGAWLTVHAFLRGLVARGHTATACPYRAGGRRARTLDGVDVVPAGDGAVLHAEVAKADVVVVSCGERLGVGHARRLGIPVVGMAHGPVGEPFGDLTVWNAESNRNGQPGVVCYPPVDRARHKVATTGDDVTLVNCSRPKGVMTAWRLAEAHPHRSFLGVTGGYGEQVTPRALNWEQLPTQPDMRLVWSRTRVLLMPSEFEAWGMSGLEAMCNGIPVIAHPTPGLVESLHGAGIFCDRDDVDQWARELDRLDDPAEYQLASAASLERAAQLDPDDSIDRFAAALEALL